jgi:Flp pilus assembly protein TadD
MRYRREPLGMFKKIWQWLKKLIKKLLGGNNKHRSSSKRSSLGTEKLKTELLPPLTDTDYEFLWMQLLEGVVHGWHSQKLVSFFKDLGERGKEDLWLAWLNRFEEKLLATSSPNQQLGSRMLQFGQKAQDHPLLRTLGAKSYQIGRQLMSQQPGSVIWEYDGPDLVTVGSSEQSREDEVTTSRISNQEIPLAELMTTPEISYDVALSELAMAEDSVIPSLPNPPAQTFIQVDPPMESESVEAIAPAPSSNIGDPWQEQSPPVTQPPVTQKVETLTFDELITRLKTDQNLRSQVASQLGVDSEDLQGLITVLKEKMQIASTSQEQTPPPPPNEVDEPQEFEKLFYQGLEQADQGKMTEAIAFWDQALALNPNVSAIWHNRGSALGHLGRLEEALDSFDQAIEINPQDYQAWNDRGNALYNLQQWEKALVSWEKVIAIKSDFTQAWYSRGCALEHLNRLEEALQSYDQALKLKPDFPMALKRRHNLQAKMS